MRPFASPKNNSRWRWSRCRAAHFAGLVLLGTAGCHKSVPTDDPQLKLVQELLNAQLPLGTSEDTVKLFLAERGYTVRPPQKPGTVVAEIPAADHREATPPAARVTFYFNANGKLNTFALERASGKAPK